MKITERKLRSIIRSVIKESQMNEMISDLHHWDSLVGAAAAKDIMDYSLEDFKKGNESKMQEKIRDYLYKISVNSTRGAYLTALTAPLMSYLTLCAKDSVLASSGITIGTLIGLLLLGDTASKALAKRLGIKGIDVRIDGSIKSKIKGTLGVESRNLESLEHYLKTKKS